MENRFTVQEQQRIKQKLVLENIKRVFLSSLACLVVVPLLLIVSKLTDDGTSYSLIKGALIAFEAFSAGTLITSYYLLQNRDVSMARLVYRSYWIIFEVFSFIVIYTNTAEGGKFTFYSVMLTAIMLGPVMTMSEQMYCWVIQAVYAVFASVKFGVNPSDAVNILILNLFLFCLSRYECKAVMERMMLKERAKDSRNSAIIDQMTGLLNRRGFERNADASIISCVKTRRRASLIMLDIDDLKVYNDSYGVDRGDECIRSVAGIIRHIALRNTDIVCRVEGGRFLVYMEGGSETEAAALAEKIRKAVESKRIPQGRRAGNPFVTVSAGAATCIPRSESDLPELYDEAEGALEDAKYNGRNITVFDSQIIGSYRQSRAN